MPATESQAQEQISATPTHRSLRATQEDIPSHQGSSSSPMSERLWWPRHEDLEQIRAAGHVASHRPKLPVMVSKAGQLEAESLDQELTDMLKDQLGRVFSLLKPSVRHHTLHPPNPSTHNFTMHTVYHPSLDSGKSLPNSWLQGNFTGQPLQSKNSLPNLALLVVSRYSPSFFAEVVISHSQNAVSLQADACSLFCSAVAMWAPFKTL